MKLENAAAKPTLDALPSDDEREMLRDSARGFLEQQWPADKALALSGDPRELAEIWRGLAEQGFTALGTEPTEGGLREILVVLEELGRASCPAPLLAAALVNHVFWGRQGEVADAAALLSAQHQGDALVSVAFGNTDGDANAGCVRYADGVVNGKLSFVEGTGSVTHLLVVVDSGDGLVIVKKDAPGVSVIATPGLAVPPLAEVTFKDTPASLVAIPAASVEDLNRIARLGLTARALGAANRAFEMVVEYAKERVQFGQPIGKFQAIQHKLSNCLVSIEQVRLMLTNAATAFDLRDGNWRVSASATYALASPALRQVSLETHHVFGAIGYSEEHEAPRHFRRVHSDLVRFGGVRRAREELAAYLLDEGQSLPDYDLGVAGNAFREELRGWLAEFWLGERKAKYDALPFEERWFDKEFSRGIGEKNWHAASWPKAFGGQQRSPLEQFALNEEMNLAGTPHMGAGEIQAQALMAFGTPEQKAEFLPRLQRGEIKFCLGYSEPGSGSDLASLKTRAVRDGDEWVINGTKIWTTLAEHADYMFLAARTDAEAKPQHAGISVFIVPMNTPGITIRPSMALYGHTFCQEFLDDVRIPAGNLVGEVNGGWKVLTSALATERIIMGGSVARIRADFQSLVGYVRRAMVDDVPLKDCPVIRDRIATLAAEIEGARQLAINSVRMVEQGKVPIHEAAMSKVYTGELMERLGEASLDILGMGGTLMEGASGAITNGRLEQTLRQSIMMVVGGGTAEVQRTLIAQRGLNLPR